jgi:hypothetical protein
MSGSPSNPANDVQQKTFPLQLQQILSNPELDHIISWMPHGFSWRIHQPQLFVNQVMPQYFQKQSKLTSFTRQVNGWGFKRVSTSLDCYEYHHQFFVRDKPHMVHGMRRRHSDRRRSSFVSSESTEKKGSSVVGGQELKSAFTFRVPSYLHFHTPMQRPIHQRVDHTYSSNNRMNQLPYFPYTGAPYLSYDLRTTDCAVETFIATPHLGDATNNKRVYSPLPQRDQASVGESSLAMSESWPLFVDSSLYPEHFMHTKEIENLGSDQSNSEDEFKNYINSHLQW